VHDAEALITLLTDSIYEANVSPAERRNEINLVFPESEDDVSRTAGEDVSGLPAGRTQADAALTEIAEVLLRSGEEAAEAAAAAGVAIGIEDTGGVSVRMTGVEQQPETMSEDERFKAELDAVDRRNKEAAQRLKERADELKKEVPPPKPAEDTRSRRTAQDALLILNDPGKLSELLQEDSQAARDGDRIQPAELTLLLSELSPEYRTFYEQLLADINGSPYEGESGIKKASLPDFNETVRAAQREREITEMQHTERELLRVSEQLTEQTIRTTFRTDQSAKIFGQRPYEDRPAQVRLLHKEQIFTDMPPADVQQTAEVQGEQIQRQVTIEDHIYESREIETEINRVVKEAQAQSASEISSMIDRALAAQLGTISGQVYSNVERRLDMERSRRGK
jgi:hypothetical protein